jgi:hypothetical protein
MTQSGKNLRNTRVEILLAVVLLAVPVSARADDYANCVDAAKARHNKGHVGCVALEAPPGANPAEEFRRKCLLREDARYQEARLLCERKHNLQVPRGR